MKTKSICIMMSTYNGERFIEEQLESIFAQKTDCDIKLVVRDDSSSDETIAILEKWKKIHDITLIKDGKNLGAAKSFWKLLKTVDDADYYAFVDQDDRWDENKLAVAVEEIGESDTPILWASNCRIIDENGDLVNAYLKENDPSISVINELICGSVQGCSMVFNRAALQKMRRYRVKHIPMHDLVLMEYMLVTGQVIYHSEPLFSYRVHSGNVVAKQGKSKLDRIKSTYKQWFITNKNSYKYFCREMLINLKSEMDVDSQNYLKRVVLSGRYIRARLSIIRDEKTIHPNKSALRSFKLRVLLGII